MTSAFIIEVNSQLRSDPNEETAALLRVLIHKIDNTTFGDDVPTIPQWTGPPHAIVQVQAMLYASLTASLFSAFLAMLGKQWLNRYISTDMRGTAIERSQNRQQKLNGIVTWYFDNVMESLPLMLQAALLLLGCALTRYLWDTDTTIASVILAVTSSGILFYLFITTAGSAYASCPYQTPGSRIIRSTASVVASTFRHACRRSKAVQVFRARRWSFEPWWFRDNVIEFLKRVLYELPGALVVDCYHLGQVVIYSPVAFACQVYIWLLGVLPTPTHGSDQQTTLLDLHCISWILQMSLDKDHHLSAMEHLVAVVELPNFDPSIVAGCFGAFISCIKVANGSLVVTQGLEKLAELSAMGLLHVFSHLSAIDPTSSILADISQHYSKNFPPNVTFNSLPFYHTLGIIHFTLHQGWRYQHKHVRQWGHQQVQWRDYKPSNQEHIMFTHALNKLAQSEYQRRKKVPCWILRFVLHSLSMSPLPSTSVIIDCLSIIAIDLDSNISGVKTMTLDERYAHYLIDFDLSDP